MSKAKFAAVAAFAFACSVGVAVQAEPSASQSTSDPSAQPAPAPAAKNGRDPNQVVCKRENEPGSRLGGHQDCRTRADWDMVARDSKEQTQLMQAKTNTGAGGH